MGHWQEYDTTADTGIEVWGNSFIDLLKTAVNAFTYLSTDRATLKIGELDRIEVECSTNETDMILHDVLDHFVYQLDANFRLPARVIDIQFETPEIVKIDLIWGYWIDGVSESKTEIKAVTYHELTVTQEPDGEWYGLAIFDI